MTLDLTQSLPSHVRATSGRPVEDSTLMEVWQGLSAAIVDQIADNWAATTERYAKGRQEHYFSAEFLMGRALLNNLSNLGLVDEAREALSCAPGVKLVDDPASARYPMPLETTDQDLVYVGRVREDISAADGVHALSLWCVGDQIRKGAASNAVQIAKLLTLE